MIVGQTRLRATGERNWKWFDKMGVTPRPVRAINISLRSDLNSFLMARTTKEETKRRFNGLNGGKP
jgi:hypothetical protein